MENFRNTELNIPIAKVAEALGLRPGSVKDMYFSPMRDEKEASLHIDRNKNLWHDHGNGSRKKTNVPGKSNPSATSAVTI